MSREGYISSYGQIFGELSKILKTEKRRVVDAHQAGNDKKNNF